MLEPRVLVIYTGGTIGRMRSPDGYIPAPGFLDACLLSRPSFHDASAPARQNSVAAAQTVRKCTTHCMPESSFGKRVRYYVLEFDTLLDSSSINAKATTIEENYTFFDGFVCLHGTDSLAYTCSALTFMLENLGKPVILTGSQVPMSELRNDAHDNLLGALILAGHFLIPEVCLFFDGKLYRGCRSTKMDASSLSAFDSPNMRPLALAGIDITVAWDLIHRPNKIAPLRVHKTLDAHVACLRLFPGILPEMVHAIVNLPSLRGLVLETFGAGNAPEDERLMRILADASTQGIVIVNVTQCRRGSVAPLYATGTALARAGVITGHDMTSEAALTKLSCLLARGIATAQVRDMMSRSLHGELTEAAKTRFEHPLQSRPLAQHLAVLTSLNYAIAQDDGSKVRRIIQGDEFVLNSVDYIGQTPLHLASQLGNIEMVKLLLEGGASVHIRNREGRSPLSLASSPGVATLLVQAGAHGDQDDGDAEQGRASSTA